MRGETRACKATLCDTSFQSTPLMRGETKLYTGSGRGEEFQSTPLMRGETKNRVLTLDEIRISIHSPHARGDTIYRFRFLVSSYFNPLPSCEGRHVGKTFRLDPLLFQSTPLMRGETPAGAPAPSGQAISIHSPHARGDDRRIDSKLAQQNFNPLPSCEGRHTSFNIPPVSNNISIHSPHARGDPA